MKIEKNREEKEKAMRERQRMAQSLQMEKDRALQTLNYSGKSIGNDSLLTQNRSVFEKMKRSGENYNETPEKVKEKSQKQENYEKKEIIEKKEENHKNEEKIEEKKENEENPKKEVNEKKNVEFREEKKETPKEKRKIPEYKQKSISYSGIFNFLLKFSIFLIKHFKKPQDHQQKNIKKIRILLQIKLKI